MASRISTIFWMILIVAAALGLYVVKYQVQSMQEELARQENILREERESLHVLEAEWAYLNRPERLQQLTNRHLALLTPSLSKQISSIDAIPSMTNQLADLQKDEGEESDHGSNNSSVIPVRMTQHGR